MSGIIARKVLQNNAQQAKNAQQDSVVQSELLHSSKRCLLVLNGDLPMCDYAKYEFIVCADGAYDKVKDKTQVDLVVGDMDSVIDTDFFNNSNIQVVQLSKDKDYTDGQCALMQIFKIYPNAQVDIIGATGGRFDHAWYNFVLFDYCCHANSSSINNIVIKGDGFVCCGIDCGEWIFDLSQLALGVNKDYKNCTISLLPFFGSVHIISTRGLKYSINDKIINSSGIATISNLAIDNIITIKVGMSSKASTDKLLVYFVI